MKHILNLLLVLLLVGCGKDDDKDAPQASQPVVFDGPAVAEVGGTPIPEDVLMAFMRMRNQTGENPGEREQALRQGDPSMPDIVFGTALVVLVLEIARRSLGFVLVIDDSGTLVDKIDVTCGPRHHPGGFTVRDGTALVPLAEYSPRSTSEMVRLDLASGSWSPTFGHDDHLGAAVELEDGSVLAGTWGSRVCPPRLLHPLVERVGRKLAHSLMLAVPRMTAPAALSRSTRCASFAAR